MKLTDPNDLELRHYGVLGMKWGIRRFQPYPSEYSGTGKFVGKPTSPKTNTKLSKKQAMSLSDNDLRQMVNRLQTEKQYEQLTKKEKSKLRSYMEKIIGISITAALTQKGTEIAKKKLEDILDKADKVVKK